MAGWQSMTISDGEIYFAGNYHYLLTIDGDPAPKFRHNGPVMLTFENGQGYIGIADPGSGIQTYHYKIGEVVPQSLAYTLGVEFGTKQRKQARQPKVTDLPENLREHLSIFRGGWRQSWLDRGRKV